MTHPLVRTVRRALERGRRSGESARNAGLHEVGDAVSRRVGARTEDNCVAKRLPPIRWRRSTEWQRVVAGAVAGGRRFARNATPPSLLTRVSSLSRVPDASTRADVRGDDRHRRMVGLRGRDRRPPPGRHAARRAASHEAADAPMGEGRGHVEAPRVDPLSARLQARHRSRSCSTTASSRISPTRTSSSGRRSAGRCASMRGPIRRKCGAT